jgi:anti-anti-sigma factor
MDEPIARVDVRRDGDRVIASVVGDIDLSNAHDVGRMLTGTLASRSAIEPILDLRDVTYIDSQGLRMLHQLASRLDASDVTMQVVAPPASVAGDVIRLTGIDRFVRLLDGPEGSETV